MRSAGSLYHLSLFPSYAKLRRSISRCQDNFKMKVYGSDKKKKSFFEIFEAYHISDNVTRPGPLILELFLRVICTSKTRKYVLDH